MATSPRPACRIEIVHDAVDDNHWWNAWCVCGQFNNDFVMPVEAFEAAYDHYVAVPHQGKMFIDLYDKEQHDESSH